MITPYTIFGWVYDQHGAIQAGVTITIKNRTTGETDTVATTAAGYYEYDISNFPGGYSIGDEIEVYTGYLSSTGTVVAGLEMQITVISTKGTFNIFDWPYTVRKVDVTEATTDQTTGDWVAESSVDIVIPAHVSEVSQKEKAFLDPGLVQRGVRKLACSKSIGLAVEDRIKITETGGEETEWIVHSKESFSGLLSRYAGTSRETFLLKRKITA